MRLTQAPNSAAGAVLQVTPFPVTVGSGATGEIAVRPDSAVDALTTEIITEMAATNAIAGAFLNDRNLCLTISHHHLRSVRKRDRRDAMFVGIFIETMPSRHRLRIMSLSLSRPTYDLAPAHHVSILRFRAYHRHISTA
jgi:hypothetical protein